MKSKKRKKQLVKKIAPLVILIITLFMGIGYSSVTGIYLILKGDALSKNTDGIFIYNVEYIKQNESDETASTINTYVDTTLSSTIQLNNDKNDYEIYRIYIKNNSNDNYMYLGINYDKEYFNIPNENITFSVIPDGNEGLKEKDIIQGKEERTFLIKFEYIDNFTPNESNILSSVINFKFNSINNKILFDSKGGTISSSQEWIGEGEEVYKIKAIGETYGTLPTPSKTGYEFLGWQKQVIPNYYPVEYLENKNKSMIETDILGNNSNLSFEIKYAWSQLPGNGAYANLFTSYQSENHITTRIIQYGSDSTYFNINSKAASSAKLNKKRSANVIYTETLKPYNENSFIYTSDSDSSIGNRATATVQRNPITIFNGVSTTSYKLYNFKIYDNNILKRNYIPCVSENNMKGLCDTVGSAFYYNNNEQNNFTVGQIKGIITKDEIIDFEQVLIAKWEAKEFKITFDPNGGTLNNKTQKIKYDESYENLPVPKREGFTFDGWYDGTTKINTEESYKYDEDKTFVAKWKIIVTLDLNGGELTKGYLEYDENNLKYGELPVPTKEGYKFIGWSRDEYSKAEYIEKTSTEYLKTNVQGNNNNLSFEVQYEWLKLPSEGVYSNIFSSYESENHNTTRIIQYGSKKTIFNINSKAQGSSSLDIEREVNKIYTESLIPNDDNTFTYTSNGISTTGTRVNGTSQQTTIEIFPSLAINFPIRLYYFKIYNNGELIKDYIPAINLYGKYGLYDKVSKEFLGQSGEGKLAGGSIIESITNTQISSSTTFDKNHTIYAVWEKEN